MLTTSHADTAASADAEPLVHCPLPTIKQRWKLLNKIGQGAFGQTFSALDLTTQRSVAVKIEDIHTTKKHVLKLEVAVLKMMQDCPHCCRFYGCGRTQLPSSLLSPATASSLVVHATTTVSTGSVPARDCNYLVMELLDRNLSELRRRQGKSMRFSESTTGLLMGQMLEAIRCLHRHGYLHRDIKPSNFVMGHGFTDKRGRKLCYLIDFGLARRFKNSDGSFREPRSVAGFRGTARYASIAAHRNQDLGPRDDLWSLFYVMVEFLRGSLPWRQAKDKALVGELKLKYDGTPLLDGLPSACALFHAHLSQLETHDMPDYDLLAGLFRDLVDGSGDGPEVPYDWDRVRGDSSVPMTSTSSLPQLLSTLPTLPTAVSNPALSPDDAMITARNVDTAPGHTPRKPSSSSRDDHTPTDGPDENYVEQEDDNEADIDGCDEHQNEVNPVGLGVRMCQHRTGPKSLAASTTEVDIAAKDDGSTVLHLPKPPLTQPPTKPNFLYRLRRFRLIPQRHMPD